MKYAFATNDQTNFTKSDKSAGNIKTRMMR